MKLAKLNPVDVRYIVDRMRERDRQELFALRWDDSAEDLAEAVMSWGEFSWVAGLGNEPIAAIGATLIHPGNWQVWAFGTDRWPEIALSLTRHVRRVMTPALLESGMLRSECKTLDIHTNAHRWLEVLGAEKESENPNYGRNGETFFTYVWLRDKLLSTINTKQTAKADKRR